MRTWTELATNERDFEEKVLWLGWRQGSPGAAVRPCTGSLLLHMCKGRSCSTHWHGTGTSLPEQKCWSQCQKEGISLRIRKRAMSPNFCICLSSPCNNHGINSDVTRHICPKFSDATGLSKLTWPNIWAVQPRKERERHLQMAIRYQPKKAALFSQLHEGKHYLCLTELALQGDSDCNLRNASL